MHPPEFYLPLSEHASIKMSPQREAAATPA